MYQLGIFNISQLLSVLEKTAKAKKNQPIAIDLYAQISDLEAQKQSLAEEIILENFSFSDGSYKKTHSNRFADFDEKIIACLKNSLEKNKKYTIHDLAVSDGRTSFDFFSKLEKYFSEIDFYASDKNIAIHVFPDAKNKAKKIIADEQGKILQIILPPFVLNIYSSKRALAFKIKKALCQPLNFILTRLLLVPLFRNIFIKAAESEKQKIILIKNEILALTKNKNNFHIINYDILEKNSQEFEIIRAMNILNTSYFSPSEAKKIIANIFSSLKENGFFIIGSNKDAGSEVNGDLFVKKNGRLESLMKFGQGAPYRDLILTA